MIRLLATLLVAFSLFLSPMAMEADGGMAMAHATQADMGGGCAGMDHSTPDDQDSDFGISCASACAAIPGSPAEIGDQALRVGGASLARPAQVLTGIWPERETPPPRIAPEI